MGVSLFFCLTYWCIKPPSAELCILFSCTLLSSLVVIAASIASLYNYAGFCSLENSGNLCSACVRELLSCLGLLLNQHKASTVRIWVCVCVCEVARGTWLC